MRLFAARLAGLLLCLFSVLVWAAPADLVAIPVLTARGTDQSGVLSGEQKASLEQKLASFEASKGAQIALLIVPTTQPETIEQFAIRVFDAWKLGRKGVDDGLLLLVAKDDRRLRIEVGYGLEGVINDALAKRIVSDVITPKFKTGDLPGGIVAGIDAILKVVEGEPLPEPAKSPKVSFSEIPETLIFGFLIAAVIGGTILRRLLGNLLGTAVVGGLTGAAGWLMLGGLVGIVGGVVVGIFLAFFGLDILMSGILNGGRGGGGSRGGGFGGGGGSGGGGGASGSW